MIDIATILEDYNALVAEAQELMTRKNADYKGSWEEMEQISHADHILAKIRRVKTMLKLEMKGQAPQVSEGIESEIRDILNYCVLLWIKRGMDREG